MIAFTRKYRIYIIECLTILFVVLTVQTSVLAQSMERYWRVSDSRGIVWDVYKQENLPHSDNIEMAGRKVAAIIYYSIDENRQLQVKRDIIFPQMRTLDHNEYRAYLRHTYEDDVLPVISSQNRHLTDCTGTVLWTCGIQSRIISEPR